ncbi:MAG TPA: ADP-forming succinate--CoA ligase subunit beta [Myxococcota bacterium]|nr:ADP-forming succinate--CoA ligase subunit beta [Myxococcota bacterium]
MNVHEYQAKQLLREYGVPVPDGALATTPADAEAAARGLLRGAGVVVKAQVHAGGRGKAGGVKLAKSASEAKHIASQILGMTLRSHQTGPEGKLVRKVYVEACTPIASELYLALALDRSAERIAIIASREGGVEIEEIAARDPGQILSVAVDPAVGLGGYQVRQIGFGLGFDMERIEKLERLLQALLRLLVEKDASLVEINPLVLTDDAELLALDAKLNFDDNALYRQPEIAKLRDPDEEDPREREAREIDLAYVGLDGDIGCMVNGAGLAMATLDVIQICGGRPANFLDVGGGADQEKVRDAFKLILRDPNVKAILVNIFGGIVRCDLIARGIAAAASELGVALPLVVRLQGNAAAQGREILAGSGLRITSVETLREAGEVAVAAARGAGG